MDFITDIGKKLTESAKTVTKKSEDLVEITKMHLAISNEEDRVKGMLYEIGSQLYKNFLEGQSFGECFDEKANEVKEVEATIAKMREKILELKGSKVCKACNAVIDIEVNYCPNCGAKAEKPVVEEPCCEAEGCCCEATACCEEESEEEDCCCCCNGEEAEKTE